MAFPTDPRFVNLTGRTFGKLTVIHYFCRQGKAHKWKCHCCCGNAVIVFHNNLIRGHTVSCGCRRAEFNNQARLTHGHSRKGKETREYQSWLNIKNRTGNPNVSAWKYYGGRGITMCQRWKDSFEMFLADMGPCPEGYEIERKDNNGNYEPGNCEWIPPEKQASNKRNNVKITYNGRTQILAHWSKECGIRPLQIQRRLAAGWSVQDALYKPLGPTHVRYKPSNIESSQRQTEIVPFVLR